MPPAAASSSKGAVKTEDKATKDPQQSLGDDEFEFSAAGSFHFFISSFLHSFIPSSPLPSSLIYSYLSRLPSCFSWLMTAPNKPNN
jgi:hypothetical protein